MNEKQIGKISDGINLDHIPQGNAKYIIQLLNLADGKNTVGIGLNLTSRKLGRKDLIKVENYYLSNREVELVSLFALGATYSEIHGYQVSKKIVLELPQQVRDLIICPNSRCISHQHLSVFNLSKLKTDVVVECHYCNQKYPLSAINKFNL